MDIQKVCEVLAGLQIHATAILLHTSMLNATLKMLVALKHLLRQVRSKPAPNRFEGRVKLRLSSKMWVIAAVFFPIRIHAAKFTCVRGKSPEMFADNSTASQTNGGTARDGLMPAALQPTCGCEASYHAGMTLAYDRNQLTEAVNFVPNRHSVRRGEREPLIVHVGKTCGSSLRAFLGNNGVSYSAIHVHPVPLELISRHDKIIVPVRDPVSRFVSAFNFQFETQPHGWYHSLYKCFRTANAFALELDQPSACGQFARRLLASPSKAQGGHITMGLCYYLGGMLGILRKKQVWIVRTSSCSDDANGLLRWLHVPSVRSSQLPSIHAAHTVKRFNESDVTQTHLSAAAAARLKRWLADEYAFLAQLEAMSVNQRRRAS